MGKVAVLIIETDTESSDVHLEDNRHADTCAVGIVCYIKHYIYRHFTVNAFLESYTGTKVPILNALYEYY